MSQLIENKQNGPVLIENFEPTSCAGNTAQAVANSRLQSFAQGYYGTPPINLRLFRYGPGSPLALTSLPQA
jgi:hypothetical protein